MYKEDSSNKRRETGEPKHKKKRDPVGNHRGKRAKLEDVELQAQCEGTGGNERRRETARSRQSGKVPTDTQLGRETNEKEVQTSSSSVSSEHRFPPRYLSWQTATNIVSGVDHLVDENECERYAKMDPIAKAESKVLYSALNLSLDIDAVESAKASRRELHDVQAQLQKEIVRREVAERTLLDLRMTHSAFCAAGEAEKSRAGELVRRMEELGKEISVLREENSRFSDKSYLDKIRLEAMRHGLELCKAKVEELYPDLLKEAMRHEWKPEKLQICVKKETESAPSAAPPPS